MNQLDLDLAQNQAQGLLEECLAQGLAQGLTQDLAQGHLEECTLPTVIVGGRLIIRGVGNFFSKQLGRGVNYAFLNSSR